MILAAMPNSTMRRLHFSLDIDSYKMPLVHLITDIPSREKDTEFELDENGYQ